MSGSPSREMPEEDRAFYNRADDLAAKDAEIARLKANNDALKGYFDLNPRALSSKIRAMDNLLPKIKAFLEEPVPYDWTGECPYTICEKIGTYILNSHSHSR